MLQKESELSVDFKKQVLELLSKNKDGIAQCDIWKILNMDRRKCAKIIGQLEEHKLITKSKTMCRGAPSYLIKLVAIVKEKKKDFSALISNGKFSPCTGCKIYECDPKNCGDIMVWLAV